MNQEVQIPFRGQFEYAMITDGKTMTTRRRRYGLPGDTFKAFGKQFKILAIFRMKLATVAEMYFAAEGFASLSAFINCWDAIHHSGYDGQKDRRFWCHIFTRIEEAKE